MKRTPYQYCRDTGERTRVYDLGFWREYPSAPVALYCRALLWLGIRRKSCAS